MAEILTITSSNVGRDVAKLRYAGYYVRKTGSTIFYSREQFELIPAQFHELGNAYEQESVSQVSFTSTIEATKALHYVKYKYGVSPVVRLTQNGMVVSVSIKIPAPMDLLVRPKCFSAWLSALNRDYKSGALIVLNRNLRNWGEPEWSVRQFTEVSI